MRTQSPCLSTGRLTTGVKSISRWLLASALAVLLPGIVGAQPTTTRVSVGPGGVQGNDDSIRSASISADGRWVVFDSYASNLVTEGTTGGLNVFVYDQQTGTTTRASVGLSGAQANGRSEAWGLSSDGRWVLFASYATNLVAADTNGEPDVFVHDQQTGATTRVSVPRSWRW